MLIHLEFLCCEIKVSQRNKMVEGMHSTTAWCHIWTWKVKLTWAFNEIIFEVSNTCKIISASLELTSTLQKLFVTNLQWICSKFSLPEDYQCLAIEVNFQ